MPEGDGGGLGQFLIRHLPPMFLVWKLAEYKRQKEQRNKKSTTEKELHHLNHKIDKLLVKLEEHEHELASNPDEECVICISAKATMQTFPCAHRVVCRRCFVKTIQVAVSQRLLPLRCVICRTKILRLKQTTRGGIVTGSVIRSRASGSSSSSSSGSPGSFASNNSNPFYISPTTSPISPVTEVFREQRAVWVRNYQTFGYGPNGQSPDAPPEAFSKSATECVLHKHCLVKTRGQGGNKECKHESTKSITTTLTSASSAEMKEEVTIESGQGESDDIKASQGKVKIRGRRSRCSEKYFSNPWEWQLMKKKHYRLHHRRRRGKRLLVASARPNSLLLPIDEREELQELLSVSKMSVTSNSHSINLVNEEEETGGEILIDEESDQVDWTAEELQLTGGHFDTSFISAEEAQKFRPIDDVDDDEPYDRIKFSDHDKNNDCGEIKEMGEDREGEEEEDGTQFDEEEKEKGMEYEMRWKTGRRGSNFAKTWEDGRSFSSRMALTWLKAKNLVTKGKWTIY